MGRMPEVGEIVDDVFRVDAEVDSGNFGSVYKVTDLLESRILALKVLRPGTHDEAELRKRFEREARLVYSLQHKHVVRVYYYGQTPSGLPYLAMEFLNGTDLRSLIHSYGQLHDALAKRITMETLSALEAAHQLKIIHRDLKPANIYLVNDGSKGHVKVLDFGFAKAFDDDGNSELTNAQTLVGTPAYMAPELVHKQNVGPAADVYAMGLIFAEMLLGKKIIDIENVYDTILFQASHKPIKLPKALKKSPFYKVISKAITKDLSKRYASAAEMMHDLSQVIVEGESTQDASPSVEPAPERVFGSADMNAATNPASYGRPSLDEIDDDLTTQFPSSGNYGLDSPRQSGGYPAAQVRVREDSGQRRPQTGQNPSLPLDSQRYVQDSYGSDAYGADARAHHHHDPNELSLEHERPIERHRKRSGGIPEIAMGVIVGVAIIGVVVLVLFAMTS